MSVVGVKLLISKILKNGSNNTVDETSSLLDNSNTKSNTNTTLNTDTNNSNSGTNVDSTAATSLSNDLESGQINNSNNYDDNEASKKKSFPLNYLSNVDPRIMSDLIIGLSDGLTVPFALTAGLSSLGDTKLVITGGMAELVSGAISMGLGGYLAAKSESEFYFSQVRKEKQLFFQNQDTITDDLYEILLDMGASEPTAENFISDLSKNPQMMIDFIIRYGKGLDEPPEGRILSSALTIGSGYFFGGFIPLIPYFFFAFVNEALLASVILMLITLFWFGYFKSIISMGEDVSTLTRVLEGFQMVLIGSIAAGSAWSLVYLLDS
jgi:VIT1/CCC1 family predicted Fe2+/Mn2+ transporter